MPRYIAFLRAINVGGHTVKMNYLSELFAGLGFANIETFIASGNVLFDAPSKNAKALEKKIETHLADALGYEVATFIRTTDEVTAVSTYVPFAPEPPTVKATLYVAFLKEALSAELQAKVMAFTTPVDAFHLNNRELYWLCRVSSQESKFSAAALERAIKLPVTFRNMNTPQRIAAKFA
jgi:uncharacterized protein (DUF1697 family)